MFYMCLGVFMRIIAIGGFGDITGNSLLVIHNNEALILDLGLNMENYIQLSREEDVKLLSVEQLVKAKALPDYKLIKSFLNKKVLKAIVLSHAHLDHVGAIPFIIDKLRPELVIGSGFTITLLKSLFKKQPDVKMLNLSFKHTLRLGSFDITLLRITHSVPETAVIMVKAGGKTLVYANDFKFDNKPLLGKPSDIKSLKDLKPDLLVIESLYSMHEGKALTESIAKEMLKDIFTTIPTNKGLIVTTFSSHIARLKTIVEFSKKLGRKPVMLGRSLDRYTRAAALSGIYRFKVKTIKYRRDINRFLRLVSNPSNNRSKKYTLIVTGNQGEPEAVLSRMLSNYRFKKDVVVFSSKTIPTKTTMKNRKKLVDRLRDIDCSVYEDVHVSGHAHIEDLKNFLHITKPKLAIPTHSDNKRLRAFKRLALNEGFESQVLKNNEELDV